MATTIVKDRLAFGDVAVLVRMDNGDHFVVSHIAAAFDHGGRETLAFNADPFGEVTDFYGVAGGRGMSIRDAIFDLDLAGGWEVFWPVAELVGEVIAGTFAPSYDWSGADI